MSTALRIINGYKNKLSKFSSIKPVLANEYQNHPLAITIDEVTQVGSHVNIIRQNLSKLEEEKYFLELKIKSRNDNIYLCGQWYANTMLLKDERILNI